MTVKERKTHAFLSAVLALLLGIGFAGTVERAQAADLKTPATEKADLQRLDGRWVRPDGGYRLELRNVEADGSLSAAYYNPRPVRVLRAFASKKENTISVFVELRDVNYPGSTYSLQYDPATDRLQGTYFQAVEKRTFDIVFLRAK